MRKPRVPLTFTRGQGKRIGAGISLALPFSKFESAALDSCGQ